MGATLTFVFALILTVAAVAFLAMSGIGVYSLIVEGLGDDDSGWLYSPSSGSVVIFLVGTSLFGLASAGLAFVLWYAFLNRY